MGRNTDDDEGGDEEQNEISIGQHYGWLFTLYELAETPILHITGDKSITDINVIFVFNYLSLRQELEREKQKKMKQEQQKYKIK